MVFIGHRVLRIGAVALALAWGGLSPAALRAQDRPIQLGSPQGGSVDELTGEDRDPLQVTGFGVGDFSWDPRSGDNTARAGKLAVAFFRELSDRFWFFGQLTTALASGDEEGDAAVGDEVPTEIEIDNFLVNFTPSPGSGLSLAAGKFDVPVGFERDDEPLNFQASSSYNFELARPAKMVGLVGRWSVNPSVDLTAMLGNGWDAQVDANKQKTGGMRIGFLPTEHASVGVSGLLGGEGEPGAVHQRYLLSLDYAFEPSRNWIVAGEANRGGEREALADGGDAAWSGVTLTLFRRLGEHVGATL
ncbi:MAG TPA: outer membrane beta-barrel protein, partial [Longimicrobiales bacterium]|nr:outer membrane beta-barrel protein [Longimicrobiales bacterium]